MTLLLRRGLFVLLAPAAVLVPAPACAQVAPAPVANPSVATPYKVAVGVGPSFGYSGWGQPPTGMGEIGGRFQAWPWLGIGVAYFGLGAGNNEGEGFSFSALELNAHWHPIVGRWFDPFLRVGGLGITSIQGGGYMNTDSTSRWGLEGMAGFDFVLYRVAIGPHFRAGFTNRYWATAGLHVELRI